MLPHEKSYLSLNQRKWMHYRRISNIVTVIILIWFYTNINGLQSFYIPIEAQSKTEVDEALKTVWRWSPLVPSKNCNFPNCKVDLRRCLGGKICNNEDCSFLTVTDGIPNHSYFEDDKCEVFPPPPLLLLFVRC